MAGIERDRSRLVEYTVPFGIRKFRYFLNRKFKPEFLVEWNAPSGSGDENDAMHGRHVQTESLVIVTVLFFC